MAQEGWLSNSYLVDDDLIQKLIPRMAFNNFDWHNVKTIQDIKGSNGELIIKMKNYIRNLKKDSIGLDAAVGHVSAARKPPPNILTDVSSQQQKQGSQDQTPGNVPENLDHQEQAQPNSSSMKKVKIATPEVHKPADYVSANLENFRKRNFSEQQIGLMDQVVEMQELFCKIQTNRRELKALKKEWDQLQTGSIRYSDDPFEDSD